MNDQQLKLLQTYMILDRDKYISFSSGSVTLDDDYTVNEIQDILDILKDDELLNFIISNVDKMYYK